MNTMGKEAERLSRYAAVKKAIQRLLEADDRESITIFIQGKNGLSEERLTIRRLDRKRGEGETGGEEK